MPTRLVRRRARAQGLVEFALILPFMILLLLAAIDFGRLFFSYVQVTNAAREAAAFAGIDPAVAQAGIDAHAAQEANVQSQGGEGALSVSAPVCTTATAVPSTVPCATAAANNNGTGNQVTIVVSRPFTFVTPLIGGMFPALTLSSSATSPVHNAPPVPPAPTPTPVPTPTPDPCLLVADFTFDQDRKQDPVTFDASFSTPQGGGCGIVSYAWNFDDPQGSGTFTAPVASPNASHDYGNQNRGEIFNVTVRIKNAAGQTATFQQPVLTKDK